MSNAAAPYKLDDLDGDGIPEFSAYWDVYKGGSSPTLMTSLQPGTAALSPPSWTQSIVFPETWADALPSYWVAGGDYDGDGLRDVVIGRGTVGTVPGVRSICRIDAFSSANGTWLAGRQVDHPDTRFGEAVHPVGDLDGDGFEEFVVGECWTSACYPIPPTSLFRAGRIHLVDGHTFESLRIHCPVRGRASREVERVGQFGAVLRPLGDITGNGCPDVLVRFIQEASLDDPYPRRNGLVAMDLCTGEPIFEILGGIDLGTTPPPYSAAGFAGSVQFVGDVGGNGFPEFGVRSFSMLDVFDSAPAGVRVHPVAGSSGSIGASHAFTLGDESVEVCLSSPSGVRRAFLLTAQARTTTSFGGRSVLVPGAIHEGRPRTEASRSWSEATLRIPKDPQLLGTSGFAQWVFLEDGPSGQASWRVSDVLRLTLVE